VSCKALTPCALNNIAGWVVWKKQVLRKGSALFGAAVFCWPGPTPVSAGDTNSVAPKFLGAQTCSSSSCHGGAGNNQNQFTIWAKDDFHHERPFALLETRRSATIAEILKISNPARDTRCTVCHAPFHTVPPEQLGPEAHIIEGVSCENCHAPAENWLRSHTRTDWTAADRVCAGMRDLRNLYVRANTCVACHQNVHADILKAGHPELIFELDGQSVAEPKHWSETTNWNGAQAWFVGQAVALREMSWQLANEKSPTENQINRWRGLVWLVGLSGKTDSRLPLPPDTTFRPNEENFQLVQKWSDNLAMAAANASWTKKSSQAILSALANASADFGKGIPQPVCARRAERLALALDRLVAALPMLKNNEPAQAALNRMFADVQSLPDFDPNQFAKHLNEFQTNLADVSK
jgi:Cytochrome c554 and c-prime